MLSTEEKFTLRHTCLQAPNLGPMSWCSQQRPWFLEDASILLDKHPLQTHPDTKLHTHSRTYRDFGGGGGGENASIPLLSLGNSKANEADLLIPVPALLFCPEELSVGQRRCQAEELAGSKGPFSTSLPQL